MRKEKDILKENMRKSLLLYEKDIRHSKYKSKMK